MAIIQLDKNTIEQIAAGEVIESPVSIVKELVENSIDANSKNITVEIKNGGKTYIRITDDGCGIDEKEIEKAFKRHTTSKIKNFSDLYDLFTLGFRGEALSSVISCANLTIISKTEKQKLGKKLIYVNNILKEKISLATNRGTSIEVTSLFNNLPVRRKFLKSDITEGNKITKLMYALALGYDNISFKFIKDERIEFQTNSKDFLEDKILKLIDNNLKDHLIKLDDKNDLFKIYGFISSFNYYRGNRSLQYLYVNGRYVNNSEITKSLEREYKSLIPSSRYPAYFLFISTDTKNIDVNIHPNKKEIKFIYEDDILELISKNIGNLLYENKSAKEIKVKDKKEDEIIFYEDNYKDLLNAYNKKINENLDIEYQKKPEKDTYNENEIEFFEKENLNSEIKILEINDEIDNKINEYSKLNSDKEIIDTDSYKIRFKDLNYKSSIFNRYSIYQYKDKVLLLDHRRADEKIKFEKFSKEFIDDRINSQQLLEPIIINLRSNEVEKFNNKKNFFSKLGFQIENFSKTKIIIREVPFIFQNPEDLSYFYDLLDSDEDNNNQLLYKISKIIKKSSFRKGDKIDENEADSIIKQLLEFENPYKTLNGNNTFIILDEKELEKYFER